MALSKAEIAERVEEGAVHSLVTFEIVGRPQEHVVEALTTYVDQLKSVEQFEIISIHREEPKQLEKQEDEEKPLFSTFAEVDIVVPDLESITYIAVNLMPASVEILAPSEFRQPALDIQNWINDVLSHLHEVGQSLRTQNQKNAYLHRSMNNLLRNFIHILLANGPKTIDELQKMTGVDKIYLDKIMEKLTEDDTVAQEDGKWILRSLNK